MLWRSGRLSIVAAALLAAALVWVFWPEGDERAIKRRLDELVEEANASGGEGLALVTRAAQLGSYFTSDVVVDLGGTPIAGRESLVGFASRFQPAAQGVVVGLADVAVAKRQGTEVADVALTVTVTGVDARTGERTMDAREFALELRKESGEWLIARASAVDTLK